MMTQVSFVAYPVNDVSASRKFYDAVLGIEGTEMNDDWIEYDVGGTTFAITQADADHPAPVCGALVAFEVEDLDSELSRLRTHAVEIVGNITETDVCRFVIAHDPDGSEFLMHQRKALPAPPSITAR